MGLVVFIWRFVRADPNRISTTNNQVGWPVSGYRLVGAPLAQGTVTCPHG